MVTRVAIIVICNLIWLGWGHGLIFGAERELVIHDQHITLPVAQIVWEYQDVAGDDHGPGNYSYPLHTCFAQSGLFDLTLMRIWEWGQQWIVDVELVYGQGHWPTPEGFQQQLIDIYFDVIPDVGITKPAITNGPQVVFSHDFAWEYRVKLAPWGKSSLYTSTGNTFAIKSFLLPDGCTIRTVVEKNLLHGISQDMKVIAWISGYDPFGPDHYRLVEAKASVWHFGGGQSQSENNSNVIDLLAPPDGPFSQFKQLSSSEQKAIVHPVKMSTKHWSPYTIVMVAVSFLAIVAGGLMAQKKMLRRT